jgi:hypothetical protein
MPKTGGSEITAPIPGSLTDAVKAIRELLGLVGDLAKGGGWVVDIYQGRQRRVAARNLETLRFTKSGTRPHLEHIIAGTHTPEDIEAIARQMAESAGEVETSIRHLSQFKDKVRERYGMRAVELLEKLIYGPSGKMIIRHSLLDLVAAAGNPKTPKKVIRDRAAQVLRWIESLNSDLCQLHDLILFENKK